MTCIVGVETKDGAGVLLGADTMATSGNRTVRRAGGKLARLGDGLIVGCAGSTRGMQIVKHKLKMSGPRSGLDVEKWLVSTFVPRLREVFEGEGWLQTEDSRVLVNDTWMLIGVRGSLFALHQDLQLERTVDGYHSIGTGSQIARGVLYATHGKNQLRVELALKAADYFDSGTGAPFDYMRNYGH